MKVALTNSVGSLLGLEDLLNQNGFQCIRVPLIRTETILEAKLEHLLVCKTWLFTSANAVKAIAGLGMPLRDLPFVASIGPATSAAIVQHAGTVHLQSTNLNAESLAQELLGSNPCGPIAWPHGNKASDKPKNILTAAGLELRAETVYTTSPLAWPQETQVPSIVLLASPSAVKALPAHVATKTKLIAIGSNTAAELWAKNWDCVVADAANFGSILETLQRTREAINKQQQNTPGEA